MKKYIISFILIVSIGSTAVAQDIKGYKLTFKLNDVEDSTLYLSYFYGAGQYYRDTAQAIEKGVYIFENKEDTLEYGMYSLITKDSKIIDFLVDAQNITIEGSKEDIIHNVKFKNSPENTVFFNYLKYLRVKQNESKELNQKLAITENEKEKEFLTKKIAGLDDEVEAYLENFHKENEGTLASNFILSMEQPRIPKKPEDSELADSVFALYYYKNHYLENINFKDGRLVRTPTYHEKLEYYIEKLTYQQTDSLIESCDEILGLAQQNQDLFKYTLSWLTSRYERSNKMDDDAVFVHLVLNYFDKGLADEWYDKTNLKKLIDKAKTLEPLLIGKVAPNLVLKDTAQKKVYQLHDVKAKFTILYIWSPTCGHCKVATPELLDIYHKYKKDGVKVYAVNERFENKEWIDFINEHNLDFINVSDGGDFVSNFRDLYDVYSTPHTYLLDKDKKILAKKVPIETLDKILEHFIEKEKNEK